MKIRIIEITGCGECPHIDRRWVNPPWNCHEDSSIRITKKNLSKIPRGCPLITKEDYLDTEMEEDLMDITGVGSYDSGEFYK